MEPTHSNRKTTHTNIIWNNNFRSPVTFKFSEVLAEHWWVVMIHPTLPSIYHEALYSYSPLEPWRGESDSVTDSSMLSNPADAQNVSCLGLFGEDICPKSCALIMSLFKIILLKLVMFYILIFPTFYNKYTVISYHEKIHWNKLAA